MVDVAAVIAGAKRPERTVELCLRSDLVAELEDAQRRLREAQQSGRDSLADSGAADDVRAEVERIKEAAREHTLVFRFRAINHYEVRQLVAELPPRPDVPFDKQAGHNVDAMVWHLFRRCLYDPDLSDEQVEALIGTPDRVGDGVLSPAQWAQLDEALSSLNFATKTIPF
jgi:hypothetical protein